MKKLKAIFYLELALFAVLTVLSWQHPPAVRAQASGYVNVIGTVPTYAGGQLTGSFVNQSSLPQLPLLNGSTFPQTVILNLDVNGHFSGSVADNGIIVPTPSLWHFVLCWKTGNPSQPCYPVDIPITCVNNPSCSNGTLDISSYFANAPPPNAITQPITSPIVNNVRIVGSASTTDLGQEINAAFAGCGSNCEVDVRAFSGQYPWLTTAIINKNSQLLKGLGPRDAVQGNYTGTGCAIQYKTDPFGGLAGNQVFSGGIENITIEGTSAGTCGIHTGNVIGGHLSYVTVQGFTGATGKCIWIDNTKDSNNSPAWYERNTWIDVQTGMNFGTPAQQCTYGVYADNNGGTNSLGYNKILGLGMNVNPGQYGIYLDGSTGQVFWYNGVLYANANVNSGNAQVGSIPEVVHLSNNTFMKWNTVKLDGENNCLASQSCDQTTGYGIHVTGTAQFINYGANTFPVWSLGNVNDNSTQVDSLAFIRGNIPWNYTVTADQDVVIARGPNLGGDYWVYANGSNRGHSIEIKVAAQRFDTSHYNISVPLQYAFSGQAVITNPRVVFDANSVPQLVVSIGNRNSANVNLFAQYHGTQDHVPDLLPGVAVGTTPATTTYSNMVDLQGNVVNGQNYTATRVAATDCYQLSAGGNCVMKSVTTQISADGTYLIADTTGNLTGRFVLSWSSPNRLHDIIADVGATRFDTNYAMTKTLDYAYVGQQVFTGLAVLSDTNQDPQLQVTIGNRNDGSNPHTLTVTWYGDAANVPNLLPADALGVTARTNTQPAGFVYGITGNIGGSALAAGACSSGTVTIIGAQPPSAGQRTMTVSATPTADPGPNYYTKATVSSANTVTVSVCAVTAGTPAATTYTAAVSE